MKLRQPIVFEPLFMERVWGGRRLEVLFNKRLPAGLRIGEAWEIVDRADAQSVVHTGPLKGKTLHELWMDYREAVFGRQITSSSPRFPLLLKLLDAEDRLSVQVHPPARIAALLQGEPKTEMWYLADAQVDSSVYAGLKRGVTRTDFEEALRQGNVADLIHRIAVRRGDSVFIPSGRIHAIGGGSVIVEVQQNSDTTYRVFDWNRLGSDGKARSLHIEQSMEAIDFDDVEPGLVEPAGEVLVGCEDFIVEKWTLTAPRAAATIGEFAIFTCLSGEVECAHSRFGPGDFFLVPAELSQAILNPVREGTTLLRTCLPHPTPLASGPESP